MASPPDASVEAARAGGNSRSRRPPLLLTAVAATCVAALLLPPAFLAVRAGLGDGWSVLTRATTAALVGRTLLLVAVVAAGAIVVGVPMGWLVVRTNLPAARWWMAASSLPLAMPSFVAALSLLGAFGPRGFLQQLLEPLGVDRLPDIRGLPGAAVALVMATFPYVFLLTVAALRSIDPSLEDAARGLGRRPLGVLVSVTLPQIRRAVAGGALITGLYVISDFGVVSLMRYDTLTRAIFVRNETFQAAQAAVLGLVLVALTIVFLALEHWARGGRTTYRLGPGTGRTPRRIALGRWTPVALTFCSSVVLTFVAIPVAVLVFWLARARSIEVPWQAAVNSVAVALVVAVIVTLAAVPVSVLARRYTRPWTVALERAAYASNALPGLVVGLALVFFGARYMPQLYQTLPLLILAYLIRYFAQALTGVDTALAAVNPRAEEAARGLGRAPLAVLVSVTLPMMRAGLLSGGTLVFLSVLKELPATLLLRPTGFDTLATEVWSQTTVAAYGAAAVPALMLLVVASPFLYLAARDGAAQTAPEKLPAVAGT